MRAFVLALVALGILSGCNKIGILEGKIEVSNRVVDRCDSGELFVSVQAMTSDRFASDWAGSDLETESVAPGSPYEFSITSSDPLENLFLKTRFCCDAECRTVESQVWTTLESPIYVNQSANRSVTRWTQSLTEAPVVIDEMSCDGCTGACVSGRCISTPPEGSGCSVVGIEGEADPRIPTWRCEVDKCQIAGCSEGMGNFCDGDLHICELD